MSAVWNDEKFTLKWADWVNQTAPAMEMLTALSEHSEDLPEVVKTLVFDAFGRYLHTGRKFSREGASPLEAHSLALASVMESPGVQNLIQDAMKGMGGRDHGDE